MDTADIVKNKRDALGLTQKELGEILDKDRSTIAKYESGVIDPPGSIIIKLGKLRKRRKKKNGKQAVEKDWKP